MPYADFLAFLHTEQELITHRLQPVDPDLLLDVALMTSVPPPPFFQQETGMMVEEHLLFRRLLEADRNAAKVRKFYGVQHPPEGATEGDLRRLRDAGVRFMTLAYKGPNEYGGGFVDSNAPLTTRGEWLVRQMADNDIVLDLSHAGHTTAWDALCVIQARGIRMKVVATHCGVFEAHPHKRNLPRDVLGALSDLSGIVGIPTMSWMLTEKARDDGVMNRLDGHLQLAMDVMGEDRVCIGSDQIYRNVSESDRAASFEMMSRGLDADGAFEARLPQEAPVLNSPRRLEVLGRMLKGNAPFNDRTIEKLVGTNLMAFFDAL